MRRDKVVNAGHDALWIDGADARGHDLCFCLTDIALLRMDLPVGIGDTDIIHVDQRNVSDAGTRQRLSGPGAHTANTNYAEMRLCKLLQRLLPIKTRRPAKALSPGVAYHFHI